MKVNLSIEIDDRQRNAMATIIAGKETKRLATRDEVRDYVDGLIASLAVAVASDPPRSEPLVGLAAAPESTATAGDLRRLDLLRVDPEDTEILAGKEPGFIIGWNRVKRRGK